MGSSKVHIVGGPGSGKTTLAGRLGRLLDVPVHDLDTVAYDSVGRRRALAQRHAAAEDIAAAPGWVTEGIYLSFCDPLAERAAAIVWLDVSWRVAAYRIVRRHLLLSRAGTNRHPGMGRLARFLVASRRYYLAPAGLPHSADDDAAITRLGTRQWVSRYATKVIRCRTARDLNQLLRWAQTHA